MNINLKTQYRHNWQLIGSKKELPVIESYLRMGKIKTTRKYNSQNSCILQDNWKPERSKTINFDKKSDDIKKYQIKINGYESENKMAKNLILNCPWAYLSIEDKIDQNTTLAPTEKITYNTKKKPINPVP